MAGYPNDEEVNETRFPSAVFSTYLGNEPMGRFMPHARAIVGWDARFDDDEEIRKILRGDTDPPLDGDFRNKFVMEMTEILIRAKRYDPQKITAVLEKMWDEGGLNAQDIEAIKWVVSDKREQALYFTDDVKNEIEGRLGEIDKWADGKMSYTKGSRSVTASIKAALIASRGNVVAAAEMVKATLD
jgi:hypothetical protein